jgi:hypothetical protein
MSKFRADSITAKDLEDFVNQESDFAFEMRVLEEFRLLGFECTHSGTYRDPVSDKTRQYDIRAFKTEGQAQLLLSVECKNYRPNCPLLLSTVPRTAAEAFHDLLINRQPGSIHQSLSVRPAAGTKSAYKVGEPVAKKTDQVYRDSSGKLVGNDEATFAKLNQAVNGCRDLILQPPLPTAIAFRRAIVPVLVVPPGLLWQVDYTAEGAVKEPPSQVKHATLFLNQAWEVITGGGDNLSYRLSHLEFATLDALPEVVKTYLGSDGFFQ